MERNRVSKLRILVFLIMAAFGLSAGKALAQPAVLHIGVNVNASTQASSSNVRLEWRASGASSYQVYSSTNGTSWLRLTPTAGTTATVFQDNTARSNLVNLFYRVDAVSSTSSGSRTATVYPPHNNAHANYAMVTETCKNCHRTHNSVGQGLVSATSTKALCDTCHQGMLGSKYDVYTGETLLSGKRAKSLAGPFTGGSATVWAAQASSLHQYNETSYKSPGSASSYSMGCVSCHAAHDSGNYRILKSPGTQAVDVKALAITGTNGEIATYQSGMNKYCSSCHSQYLRTDSGSARTKGSDTYYRHAVSVSLSSGPYMQKPLLTDLPLEGTSIACQSCHFAHGSTVTGSHSSEVTSAGSSTMLKRMDFMALCQNCHKK